MNYNAPQDILNATNCPSEFRCLHGGKFGDFGECEVMFNASSDIIFCKKDFGKNDIVFLKSCAEDEVLERCPLAINFADSIVCRCPTCCYLYKEYRI